MTVEETTDPSAPSAHPARDASEAAPVDAVGAAAGRYGVPASLSRGQLVLHPERSEYLELVRQLKEDGYISCVDVTAVDFLTYQAPRHLPDGVVGQRYEVVAGFLSHRDGTRIRLRIQVPADDPTCPSLWPVHAGTEALEREIFDMFGITFDGHPDMTRILMPESWQGHPLRKDYPVGRIPVQFKAAPSAR
jgi:NADH-quinone oxidoreductase subunit C